VVVKRKSASDAAAPSSRGAAAAASRSSQRWLTGTSSLTRARDNHMGMVAAATDHAALDRRRRQMRWLSLGTTLNSLSWTVVMVAQMGLGLRLAPDRPTLLRHTASARSLAQVPVGRAPSQ
jgi:hypothetical protein